MSKSPIGILLDQVEFKETDKYPKTDSLDIPHVTHEGTLKISDIEITVLQLSDGQRIIPKSEIIKIFGTDAVGKIFGG